jgi:Flp pilus assembly protein CpaB
MTGWRRDVRRAVDRHRRLLAAGLTGLAVAFTVSAVRPDVATVSVATAARDLPAGSVLAPGDLVAAAYPPAAVPDGVLHSPDELTGRALAGAVRRGEPLTDARLVGSGLLGSTALPAGTVAAPVRLADGDVGRLVSAGDRVDVLAAAPRDTPGPAVVVAAGALVLAVPALEHGTLGDGALVLLAVPPSVARDLAGAAGLRLSVTLRRP